MHVIKLYGKSLFGVLPNMQIFQCRASTNYCSIPFLTSHTYDCITTFEIVHCTLSMMYNIILIIP